MAQTCERALTTSEFEGVSADAVLALILCRLGELKRAGCEDALCVVLAGQADIELERATGLIAEGCSAELALRLLA